MPLLPRALLRPDLLSPLLTLHMPVMRVVARGGLSLLQRLVRLQQGGEECPPQRGDQAAQGEIPCRSTASQASSKRHQPCSTHGKSGTCTAAETSCSHCHSTAVQWRLRIAIDPLLRTVQRHLLSGLQRQLAQHSQVCQACHHSVRCRQSIVIVINNNNNTGGGGVQLRGSLESSGSSVHVERMQPAADLLALFDQYA